MNLAIESSNALEEEFKDPVVENQPRKIDMETIKELKLINMQHKHSCTVAIDKVE